MTKKSANKSPLPLLGGVKALLQIARVMVDSLFAASIQAVATGGCFTAALSEVRACGVCSFELVSNLGVQDGDVLTWGMNRSGQLGHGHVQYVETPQVN